MKELTLSIETKEKDGKIYTNYYALIEGQKVYFKPVNWQLLNYILKQASK